MARILIPTQSEDIHAKCVQRALARKDHQAVLYYVSDFPTQQIETIEIADSGELSIHIQGPDIDTGDDFDVVWLRRPTRPVLPADMHPGDRHIAQRECDHLSRALWHLVGRDAFWVNSLAGQRQASIKPVQLQVAAEAGLRVPPTLFSNDPARIRRFMGENPGPTIYKPFNPSVWQMEEGVAYLFTAVVSVDELPDDDVLRLSPGIFQPRLEKSHELRVTFMGDRAFVARLHSQAVEVARIDWRAGTRDIEVEPDELPDAVQRGCRELMRKLGIVFGCFDFIVTPAGEHVFIEVNEMGQFLWLEEMNRDFMLLDAFCEFLIQGRPDFDWRPSAASVRFEEFLDGDSEARHRAIDDRHVRNSFGHMVDDRSAGDSRVLGV